MSSPSGLWRSRRARLVALIGLIAGGVALSGCGAGSTSRPSTRDPQASPAAPAGSAVSRRSPNMPFQAEGSFDAAGNPLPAVDFFPDGAESSIHWSLCPPPGKGPCHAIPSTDGGADPGPQPAGTVFKVTATYKGKRYSSSVTWHGRIHAVTRPVLRVPCARRTRCIHLRRHGPRPVRCLPSPPILSSP